jgi:cell division GTPase FtsZ
MLIISAGRAGTLIILGTKLRQVGQCVFVNTDAQALARVPDSAKLQLGTRTCAGMPAKTLMAGARAVHESLSNLKALLLKLARGVEA